MIKKTRAPIISPHFREQVEIARLDLHDGIFSFYDSNCGAVIPTHVEIGQAYGREGGKLKVLNQVQTNSARIDLNPNARLGNFDWLFAIDTNTRRYDDFVIAVSCSVLAIVSLSKPTLRQGRKCQDWRIKVVPQAAFVFRNPQVNPELIGSLELINRIRQSSEYTCGSKVGIIVDSELNRLSAINRREATILGDNYLPDGFEFLYATSDGGAEYPQNKLIRICDRTSSRVFKYLSQDVDIIDHIEEVENPIIDGRTTLPSKLVYKLSGCAK